MARTPVSIKHVFAPAQADTGGAGRVLPSDWKATHTFEGADDTGYILTRESGETGGVRWRRGWGRETFQGLRLRTHPDADKAAAQVMLVSADWLVMQDGERVAGTGWNGLVANLAAAVGAGGLDVGAEAASTWYKVYAIRNPTTDSRAVMFTKGPQQTLDVNLATQSGSTALRDAAARTKLSQSFKPTVPYPLVCVDLALTTNGTTTGQVWVTLEAAATTGPSGIALSTSDKFSAAKMRFASLPGLPTRFVFRKPVPMIPLAQYHVVLQADYAIGTPRAEWAMVTNTYTDGIGQTYDGTAWSSALGSDFYLRTYGQQAQADLALPSGYTQSCHIGWARNDGSSNLVAFIATDRRIVYLAQQSLGATSIDLFDVTSLLPPVPVTAFLCVKHTGAVAGRQIMAAGVPDGYAIASGNLRGGGVQFTNQTAASLINGEMAGGVVTDYSGIYALSPTSTSTYYLLGFRW